MIKTKPNLGVFVCECGNKIAGTLDVTALTHDASNLPDVAWAEHVGYWCSTCGLDRLRAAIAEQHLERVVIAGCAPRTHDALFHRALDGVNPALIRVTNLRDLCAQPHRDDSSAAMDKARDQIAMAVADLVARMPNVPRIARIAQHAVVIGGGIAGMTAALGIADAGIPVTLVERADKLGGQARTHGDQDTRLLIEQRIAAIGARANIRLLTGATISQVSGTVGQYHLVLSNGETVVAGAIVVATGAQSNLQSLISNFQSPISNLQNYAFVLCDMSPEKSKTCWHACCINSLRQAIEIKQQSPIANVTILFRELYTAGGTYDDLVWQAQHAGVQFVRYPAGQMPQLVNGEIATRDELTDHDVRVPCDQVIVAAPVKLQSDVLHLPESLRPRLPIDANGFIADTRFCLRPSERIERGIFVCGAAHYPCDARRATFEAYSVAARAVRYLEQKEIVNRQPSAAIDATRCNGCGDCARVCPFNAITLPSTQVDKETSRQESLGRMAVVDSLLCTGCGNCVSICPVKAAHIPSATDEQLEAQIHAALSSPPFTLSPSRRILLFACEWSGYSAAEIAGARGLEYSADTRIIRVNCTGRMQPGLLLKALEMGAAGVMVLGCAPGACHYEHSNERAAAVFEQTSALGNLMGLANRLALKWIPPDDGEEFARTVNDFVGNVKRDA